MVRPGKARRNTLNDRNSIPCNSCFVQFKIYIWETIDNPREMKKKVLVIENDADIRHIVQFILEQEGFATMSIPEPDTLSEISQFKPNLILIDEFINNEPGHRLCRKIKQEPLLAHLPVIILSTANDIELIATECNANDFIRKPFDVTEMVQKVVRVIEDYPLSIG